MQERGRKKFPGADPLAAFLLLLAFWVLLSGFFDVFHLALGGLSCALVAYFYHERILPRAPWRERLRAAGNFCRYLPWLTREILLANFQVAYLVWHPRLPISPRVLRFKTRLRGELARVTLANSITLTPGTLTLELREGELLVHALSEEMAGALLSGEMEDRVAEVFGEEER